MVTLTSEVDATPMEEIREKAKVQGHVAPSFTAFVIRAVALTLRANPIANRAILGPPFFKKLYQFENTNISVAVEKGLKALPGQPFTVPLLHPETKSLEEITIELRDLAHCEEKDNLQYRTYMKILRYVPRPLSNWLITLPLWSPSFWVQYRGCAAWVNSPAKAGVDFLVTTWPWPISFSFGLVKKRAIVVGDRVEARMTMPVIMNFDRRIMGGGPASRVFADFKKNLENQF